jgi:hypothetical protein
MKIVHLPMASNEPHFVQEHEVFGKTYRLEFEWIERESFWMLHVSDNDGSAVSLGNKLQTDWPISINQNSMLMLLATSTGKVLGRQNMNRNFVLVAYEAL